MATDLVPYCGTAPVPGELLARFNLDPMLIACLILVPLRVLEPYHSPVDTGSEHTPPHQRGHAR